MHLLMVVLPFQIYADMTTDGGGWMLLNSSGGGGASSQSDTVISLGLRRYIPRTRVEILAQDASSVMLASGPSNNKNQHTIISTDSRPISALRSSSTSREGAATFHYNSAYTSFTIYSGSSWSLVEDVYTWFRYHRLANSLPCLWEC